MTTLIQPTRFIVAMVLIVFPAISFPSIHVRAETIGDRLWIWGHAAGVYNDSYLKDYPIKSHIQPIDAADYLGLRNVMFIRYDGDPEPPFDGYYKPFRKMDRVVWSLTGASGVTSHEEREHTYRLAAQEKNITGFVLDDFFHGGGSPDDSGSSPWLAANEPQFPITVLLKPHQLIMADHMEIIQSNWHSGDYRTGTFVVEASRDGDTFEEIHRGVMPDEGEAVVRVALPDWKIASIRLRILSTHDQGDAMSCGLSAIRIFHGDERIDTRSWQAKATSNYPGHDAANILTDDVAPLPASVTPEELLAIRQRIKKIGRPLTIDCVVYTGQITPRALAHLEHVDRVLLWTWIPGHLDQLEPNLTALERLAPDKPIVLGCYLYDFNESKPLPVEKMRMQTELGLKWLRQGRIDGMIFLGTPVVDADLEAVKWTREWIAKWADKPLMIRR